MKSIPLKVLAFAMVLMFGAILLSPGARAKDRLLDEVVEFTGKLLFLASADEAGPLRLRQERRP